MGTTRWTCCSVMGPSGEAGGASGCSNVGSEREPWTREPMQSATRWAMASLMKWGYALAIGSNDFGWKLSGIFGVERPKFAKKAAQRSAHGLVCAPARIGGGQMPRWTCIAA